MEAFQLRLWDGRIGRWLTTDPYGQYASPYLGMGNNPISLVDPDGGSTKDFYKNLKTGVVEWYEGSGAKAGFEHLGVSYSFTDAFNKVTAWGESRFGSIVSWDAKDGWFHHNGVLDEVVVSGYKRSGGNGGNGNMTWDTVTNNRILSLDSRVQQPTIDFINAAHDAGVNLRIADGFRSIAESDRLYAQGRTTPGNIVSNARGGSSYHNYGLAFDVYIMNGRSIDLNTPIPRSIANIAINYGFEWGGNFRSIKDYPHFQMTFGQSVRDLQRIHGINQ